MRRFNYEFTARLDFSAPIKEQYVVLRCLPYPCETQRMLSGSITVSPWVPMCYAQDGFGNKLMSGSFRTPHDSFSYIETAQVIIDRSKRREEKPHPMYRHAGLLTAPSVELKEFARSIDSADAERLALAVHEHFSYVPGATDMRTTAAESFDKAEGVCQDYSQVLAALCRLKGLPARYCMGITAGTGVTHAWTEVNVNGEWLGLDSTRNCRADEGYLLFAVGRDAQDCPVECGSFIGIASQTQTVRAVMTEE